VRKTLKGRAVIPGNANGQTIVSQKPLSFWGGVNPDTGEVIDRRHDCSGRIISGKIFVFPNGKGSSTGSAVLMECMKNGTAPAAIINSKLDAILALGAIIVEILYHKTIPMVVLKNEDFLEIHDNDYLSVKPDGTVLINSN
jgi:predicted aconitase with swiveling domain